jgi:hypothetical protein
MRIKIEVSQATAVKLGRNSTTWETEIDVEALTPEQRQALADRMSIPEHLIDATGEITAASIQVVMDRVEEAKKSELARNEKRFAELSEKVSEYENGGDQPYINPESFCSPLHARVEAEKVRRVEEYENKIAPEVAAYLAGGPRDFPSWGKEWGGKQSTLNRMWRTAAD